MLEKLLENWLDNASERSYQAVFVQMLVADGYKVLHSTRHCTLEFGKDVLAVAPDGVGCVFQLKGDPGRKMNVEGFKTIQTQLVQMMAQRPSYPGFPEGPHRAYLVSNGQFNEEVQVAAHEMNNSGYLAKLWLWSRGHLLEMCNRHGLSLWPSEIKDNRALLEIYMSSGGDPLPLATFSGLMDSILSLSAENRQLKKDELRRAVSSAAWATGISLARFYEARNHYAVVMGWTVCWASIAAATGRHAQKPQRVVVSTQQQCESAILDSLSELWEEVRGREHLTEGNPMTDAEIYGWRICVLVGLLSALYFADEQGCLLSEDSRRDLKHWLATTDQKPLIWGEGAAAQMMPWILAMSRLGAKERALVTLVQVCEAVVGLNQEDGEDPLATPHYDFEEVRRDALGLRQGTVASLADRETFAGSSFVADVLLKLLVQFGLKEEAKVIWPDFNRLGHRSFELPEDWTYWQLSVRGGVESTRFYPHTYEYALLEQEIAKCVGNDWLTPFVGSKYWLILLWWQAAPQRLNVASAAIAANLAVLESGGAVE